MWTKINKLYYFEEFEYRLTLEKEDEYLHMRVSQGIARDHRSKYNEEELADYESSTLIFFNEKQLENIINALTYLKQQI